jgi:hypothetical protein
MPKWYKWDDERSFLCISTVAKLIIQSRRGTRGRRPGHPSPAQIPLFSSLLIWSHTHGSMPRTVPDRGVRLLLHRDKHHRINVDIRNIFATKKVIDSSGVGISNSSFPLQESLSKATWLIRKLTSWIENWPLPAANSTPDPNYLADFSFSEWLLCDPICCGTYLSMLARSATTVTISKHGNFVFLLCHSAFDSFPFRPICFIVISILFWCFISKRESCVLFQCRKEPWRPENGDTSTISLDMMPELKDIQWRTWLNGVY